ncbi:MAG: hypothetical protein JOZ87_14035 [Chloroflexi bacterium]|nr:hypothetical protein [Chloroflexota bacterium]
MAHVIWNGTQQEALALVNALSQHCTCEFGATGARLSTCPVHRMLLEEQRTLDGLLFARHLAERLRREEFCVSETDSRQPIEGACA